MHGRPILGVLNDHSLLKLPGIQYSNFLLKKYMEQEHSSLEKQAVVTSRKRKGNSLKGRPSNNKGKKRTEKKPRRSKLDMEIGKLVQEKVLQVVDSDEEEDLPHKPLNIHYYRSAFIKHWCSKIDAEEVHEDSIVQALLENTETNCLFVKGGNLPRVDTVDHLRENIKVKGNKSSLDPVRREADRNIRPYHFWMYNSGKWTRQQLATMSRAQGGNDVLGASHVCGGECLNHAVPEPNSLNQQRKKHHSKMKAALEGGNVGQYIEIRKECKHEPKCFVNPQANRLTEGVRSANQEMYRQILREFQ